MNFNEKTTEMGLPVWQSPKYLESKRKAIEMIQSEKYGLCEADFWILMNKTKDGEKMAYTGLIISHNGCLKINDSIENKVNPKCFILDKEGYSNSLVYTYIDDDTYEVGEFNSSNGKNNYPYAMAFKRCFDRVVLKKSKLAYSGIYSEVEADEFKEQIEAKEITKEDAEKYMFNFGKHNGELLKDVMDSDSNYIQWYMDSGRDEEVKQMIILLDDSYKEPEEEETLKRLTIMSKLNELIEITNTDRDKVYKHYKVDSDADMTLEQLEDFQKMLLIKKEKLEKENNNE